MHVYIKPLLASFHKKEYIRTCTGPFLTGEGENKGHSLRIRMLF